MMSSPGAGNVLSFDLEHWHTATLVADAVSNPRDRIRTSTRIVLDVLDDHGTSATFFVVGEVAAEYPDLIGEVRADGHEIASHGHTHTPLSQLDPETFRRELQQSLAAIERATGTVPGGYRAPNFSVTRKTPWAIDILREEGFEYDSSVFPVKTPMYGVSGAPISPYYPAVGAPFEADAGAGGSLLELPLAVFHPRVRLPVAGGFYARMLPYWVIAKGIRSLNARDIPAMIYFHPWEFNPAVPIDDLPMWNRFVSFHGIGGLRSKLERLLETFPFATANRMRGLETARIHPRGTPA